MNSSEAIATCLYTSARDSIAPVRLSSVQAVGKLTRQYCKMESLPFLRVGRALPFLYGTLSDSDVAVRKCAAEQIAELWEDGGELLLVEVNKYEIFKQWRYDMLIMFRDYLKIPHHL